MTTLSPGFEISYDILRNIVTLRLRGFWDEGLGKKFEREFQKKITNTPENGWCLLLDLTLYPSQLPEVQNSIGKVIKYARTAGMRKKAVLVDGAITPLEADLVIQDSELHVNFYFRSEHDAIRWLLDGISSLETP